MKASAFVDNLSMKSEDDKGEEVVDWSKFDDEDAFYMSVAKVTGGSNAADLRGLIDSLPSSDGSFTAEESFVDYGDSLLDGVVLDEEEEKPVNIVNVPSFADCGNGGVSFHREVIIEEEEKTLKGNSADDKIEVEDDDIQNFVNSYYKYERVKFAGAGCGATGAGVGVSGERNGSSVRRIFDAFQTSSFPLHKTTSIFLDIGSGLGCPTALFSRFCRYSIGIEKDKNTFEVMFLVIIAFSRNLLLTLSVNRWLIKFC
jgi:hypothetical protein